MEEYFEIFRPVFAVLHLHWLKTRAVFLSRVSGGTSAAVPVASHFSHLSRSSIKRRGCTMLSLTHHSLALFQGQSIACLSQHLAW